MNEESPLPHIDGLVKDQFFNRRVTVFQKKKGYRFSIDSPLLADFIPEYPEEEGMEIGTGSGIVSLLILFQKKFRKVKAIEIQKDFYEISSLNSRENGFGDIFRIFHGDFCRDWKRFEGVRFIYSNPPFMKFNGGRVSPNEEIAIARHELKIDLSDIVRKTWEILADRGSLFLVLPWERYGELTRLSKDAGYSFTRLRKVFNDSNSGAPVRFLIQLSNYRSSLVEEPPLILYKEKGVYSQEAEKIFAGKKR